MKGLSGWKSHFAIDMGTSSTLIFQQGRGIVLHEPSVIVIHKDTRQIVEVGSKAHEMVGRVPDHLEVIHPLKEGVIAHFDFAAIMLDHFIQRVQGEFARFRPSRVVITTPCGITNVQKRAFLDVLNKSRGREVILMEEPIAIGLGAGWSLDDPIGRMVLDMGGGSSKTAIISLGGIVVSHLNLNGNQNVNKAIIDHIRKRDSLVIGEQTAEEIKRTLGTAVPMKESKNMEVRGCNLRKGLPQSIQLSTNVIQPLIDEYVVSLIELLYSTLELCPPELSGDIVENGILLTGGGALLNGLAERLAVEMHLPVRLHEHPYECNVLGAGKTLMQKGKKQFIAVG